MVYRILPYQHSTKDTYGKFDFQQKLRTYLRKQIDSTQMHNNLTPAGLVSSGVLDLLEHPLLLAQPTLQGLVSWVLLESPLCCVDRILDSCHAETRRLPDPAILPWRNENGLILMCKV